MTTINEKIETLERQLGLLKAAREIMCWPKLQCAEAVMVIQAHSGLVSKRCAKVGLHASSVRHHLGLR